MERVISPEEGQMRERIQEVAEELEAIGPELFQRIEPGQPPRMMDTKKALRRSELREEFEGLTEKFEKLWKSEGYTADQIQRLQWSELPRILWL